MGDNDINIAKIIGSNIKKIRNKNKISQERLAELVGKSAQFISLLERGESGLSIGTLLDICRILDTDANSIFAGALDTKSYSDSFLNKSFESFSQNDKDIVVNLINYINSKN